MRGQIYFTLVIKLSLYGGKSMKGLSSKLGIVFVLAVSTIVAGCDNANVSYGVGFHTGSYGWGNSFSVGINNHHYRNYPRYRGP